MVVELTELRRSYAAKTEKRNNEVEVTTSVPLSQFSKKYRDFLVGIHAAERGALDGRHPEALYTFSTSKVTDNDYLSGIHSSVEYKNGDQRGLVGRKLNGLTEFRITREDSVAGLRLGNEASTKKDQVCLIVRPRDYNTVELTLHSSVQDPRSPVAELFKSFLSN